MKIHYHNTLTYTKRSIGFGLKSKDGSNFKCLQLNVFWWEGKWWKPRFMLVKRNLFKAK